MVTGIFVLVELNGFGHDGSICLDKLQKNTINIRLTIIQTLLFTIIVYRNMY